MIPSQAQYSDFLVAGPGDDTINTGNGGDLVLGGYGMIPSPLITPQTAR